MTVTISEEAQGDLESIAYFIGMDNPLRAASFVEELVAHCHTLVDHPLRYPLVPDFEERNLRRMPYRGYSVFYQVTGKDVAVIHILNDARDHRTILES
ncbi:hypothetical protein VE25_14295 [Devosia geojensis]|uniref:Plasmid stabilization protein n=1 Tax=Devosia geojensis TaxID=443610 RepID=A0A0F5FQJ6_9HYPH|nr:type II toxin-antitoxin system RelE/ParE family toxin [Devosia geojensis]KKB11121.1 hypothetical protein VE25_14295 [Devosia geojensis]